MSEITIKQVSGGRDLKRFMRFPHEIYRDDDKWVPPLAMDLKKTLAKSYPFFEHGDGELFMALREGKVVGRISAQVNDAHLKKYQDGVGFFGWFECIDDQSVADALIERAKAWLRDCGRPISAIRGPFCWDVNGENPGVLVEDHRPGPPSVLMAHSAAWYPRLLENAGFTKEKDLFAYMCREREGLSDDLMRVANMAAKRLPEFTTRPINFKGQAYKDDLKTVRKLFNSAWSENWASVDLTQAEIEVIGKGLKPIAEPDVTCVMEIEGEPVAFIICLPDINPIIKSIGGKLLPFGWLKFLLGMKKIHEIRTMLLGVSEEYRGRGLDAIILRDIFNKGRAKGFDAAELSWVLEDNKAMNALAKRLGVHDRTYRIYQQSLDAKA